MLPRCLRAATMLGAAALLPCPSVLAQVHDKGNLPAPADRVDQTISGMLNRRPTAEMDDAELAGFAKGSRIEVLTWERAYTLALVAHREARLPRGGGLVDALDPEGLTVRADRHGVADFARFRKEFFEGIAGPGKVGRTFRDPSGSYIELLQRLQALENAWKGVQTQEGLVAAYRKILEGAASGMDQLQFSQLESLLQQARLARSEAVTSYRDGLDEFKVELGLSPHAPVIIDRGSLAAFRSVFEGIDRWSTDPRRSLTQIPSLVGSLPSLGILMIDGRSFLGDADEDADPSESLLTLAARVAIKNRADLVKDPGPEHSVDQLELRVRRRIRHLYQKRRAYEGGKQRLVLAINLKDTTFERLIAPPVGEGPGPASRDEVGDLVQHQSRMLLIQDRLVELWTSFRAERLALYRDLGAMPFADWNSFYDQFTAKPARPAPAEIAPPERPASPVPAPPAPGR